MRGVIVGAGKRLTEVVHRIVTLLTSESRELQESKARREEAQRVAHVGYWVWDLDSDRVTWSDETYRIYGLMPQKGPIDLAIRIANDSKYGLHSSVLGTDLQRARRVASQIRAGRVVINGMTDDPQAPWGGFKYSGFGREYGQYGIEAFLETRAILES